jgi:hypothetical protein
VRIDVDITVAAREVDQGVLGQREQHVVVEPDAGGDLTAAGAVEVDGHLDGALGGRGEPWRYGGLARISSGS